MDRRKFFRLLPLSVLGLPAMASAASQAEKVEEPSPWVEVTCPARYGPEENWEDRKPCETRFLTLRSGSYPICPKCNASISISPEIMRAKFIGIEVKS